MPKADLLVKFKAKLHRPQDSGDWTFIHLPQEVSDQMPARSMVAVQGQMNGLLIAGILQPDNNGGHWFRLENEWSEAVNAQPGDAINFELSPAKVEPEPEVPEDLMKALTAVPSALMAWQDTTTIARRDWITWMNQGKQADTRRIRMEQMIDMLSKGKKRVCCFDRSGMASKAFYCPVASEE